MAVSEQEKSRRCDRVRSADGVLGERKIAWANDRKRKGGRGGVSGVNLGASSNQARIGDRIPAQRSICGIYIGAWDSSIRTERHESTIDGD